MALRQLSTYFWKCLICCTSHNPSETHITTLFNEFHKLAIKQTMKILALELLCVALNAYTYDWFWASPCKKWLLGMRLWSFLIHTHARVKSSYELLWRPPGQNMQYYQCFIRFFERPYWGHLDLRCGWVCMSDFEHFLKRHFLRQLFSEINDFDDLQTFRFLFWRQEVSKIRHNSEKFSFEGLKFIFYEISSKILNFHGPYYISLWVQTKYIDLENNLED